MSYKLLPAGELGHPATMIKRLSDDAFIPMNEENVDYQEYLEWVAAGNTAAAAD